ncbi:MAG: methyltransferase domain-containing protein [Hyphomicrobiales bacterium]
MASPSFLRQFLTSPEKVGGVRPSSRFLARSMVDALNAGDETVVELGPGTGVFTRQLLQSGVTPHHLICVEFNHAFAEHVRHLCPGVRVIEGDASHLPALLSGAGQGRVTRIISGLPFRNFPGSVRAAIAKAVGEALVPGGYLVQFTYRGLPPLSQSEAGDAGLTGERLNLVLRNLPPAFVWRYVRH